MNELTQEQHLELSQALFQLREQLQQTLEHSNQSTQTVNLDQQAFGRVSRGDALQQQSMAKASQSQCKERLRQVFRAISRIDSGDYGFCLACDNPVGFLRLQARPETPLCLKCQNEAEG